MVWGILLNQGGLGFLGSNQCLRGQIRKSKASRDRVCDNETRLLCCPWGKRIYIFGHHGKAIGAKKHKKVKTYAKEQPFET